MMMAVKKEKQEIKTTVDGEGDRKRRLNLRFAVEDKCIAYVDMGGGVIGCYIWVSLAAEFWERLGWWRVGFAREEPEEDAGGLAASVDLWSYVD